jgi:arylsulfatase A-like enzyme
MRILYVDIDSLRPDHLGCYGYQRPTSPHIDEIAAQGVRFTNYFCSDSPCLPSRAACFSSQPGIQNGIVAHEDTSVASTLRYTNHERWGEAPLWMHLLAGHGMTTVSFSSFANRHLAGWFHFGFRQFYLSSLKNGNENADEVNAIALPWFREHACDDHWFVHLNYWDPHTLYTEPLAHMRHMAQYPAPPWPDENTIQQQRTLTGVRTPQTLWTTSEGEGYGKSRVPTMPDQIGSRADFEHLINGYDGAIRYADEQLGVILDELERQGVRDETAIIISADHGEAFGELGQYMEHGSTSPAVNRVPLIVNWPGLTASTAGSQRDELLLNIDLAPTVSEALGLKIPSGWVGRSFLALLQGHAFSTPRREITLTHGLHTRQRAIFDGRWLYIRTYHPGYFEYPPRMLFDLQADPHQTKNLVENTPAQVQYMDEQLQAWEQASSVPMDGVDPLRLVQATPPRLGGTIDDYVERLRAQGRTADSERLLERWQRIDKDYVPSPISTQ